MGSFLVSCFLLALISGLSVIRGSDIPWMDVEEFPTTTTGFPPGTNNHSDIDTEEVSAMDWNERAQMSRMMEDHLLRMLKLSSRPPARVAESLVPGYIRALQYAIDAAPLSTASVSDDHLTWAVKAVQVIALSNVTMAVHFNIAAKSHSSSAPWRVELVFESPSLSTQPGIHRGRSKMDICHNHRVGRTGCRHWRSVRYRQYVGRSRTYRVYDVTSAVTPSWSFCYHKPCRLVLTVHGVGHTDVDNTLTILVVYQNMIPEVRATRRALRSGLSSYQGTPAKQPQPLDERIRRGVGNRGPEMDGYCRLYTWSVDFRVLNWTWIVAPQQFKAGYCAGRCPSHGDDLERANLTNHAFIRMVHRAWALNLDGGRLPPPSCVTVRYSPLSILYRTDENTFELRHVNEMVSTACGCL